MQAECPAASLVCELPAPPPGWLLPVAMAEPPREPGATAEHNAVDTAAAVTAVSAGPPDVAGVAAPGGATPVANGDDPFGFLVELHRVPCFRESVLYGGGGGALLGALHWQRTRTFPTGGARSPWTGGGAALVNRKGEAVLRERVGGGGLGGASARLASWVCFSLSSSSNSVADPPCFCFLPCPVAHVCFSPPVICGLTVRDGTGNGERATDVAVKASLLFASAYWCVPGPCREGGG